MMDELRAIAQAKKGDADAFAFLVETYETSVYRLALRMCGNAHDAHYGEGCQDSWHPDNKTEHQAHRQMPAQIPQLNLAFSSSVIYTLEE